MKVSSITLFFLLSIFVNVAYTQDNSIYKEIVENYYERNKASDNYKLIKSEIIGFNEGYKYQSDSIIFNGVENLLRKTYTQYNNSSMSQAQRDAFKELIPMILDPYFSALDRLEKKDMSKVKFVKGNILYSVEKNYVKTNVYEVFILVLELNNKVITTHIID